MPTPSLQQIQKLGLQQTLSPRMQQSLRILQAPALELAAIVRGELDANPVLEEVPPSETAAGEAAPEIPEGGADASDGGDDLEAIFRLDQEWREDDRQARAAAPREGAEEEERRRIFFESVAQTETLQEHLLAQLGVAEVEEDVRSVGEAVIGNLDERGYLAADGEEVVAWAGGRREVAERALETVRSFDPAGVGARDLNECLALQLARLGCGPESVAARVVRSHLEDLAARRFAEIAGALGTRVEEVQRAAGVIAALDPNPGGRFASGEGRYVTPDLVVRKIGEEWTVLLNGDSVPHLRIGNAYKDLLGEASQSREVRDYVHARLRAAKFLIRCIHQRQDTILRLAREIVRMQEDFLENGRAFLKPLTMAEMAKRLGVHETTVGRAAAGKYLQTPHGVFELKRFFAPGVKTADGATLSPSRLKEAIAELTGDESGEKPLSDEEIAAELKRRGMPIARRTVAKYREELGILPSHERKAKKAGV
ncbi:MAG: RNA polymerase factor sigma-54 [Verrucomicrobiae bacterium]|nr:RNA polymerase factor sigma-54 [Verrucomicrobiae bacterium]